MARSHLEMPMTAFFEERDFYLAEFRGRSVLIAVAPEAAIPAHMPALAVAVADLVRNATRVLLWWPAGKPSVQRRLLAVLGRAKAIVRRRGARRSAPPILRATVTESHEELRGELWDRFRRSYLCVLAVSGWDETSFPRAATELGVALGIPKLILVEPHGGLTVGSGRLSFVDENVLETVLNTEGEAEWSGLADRRRLLIAVRDALQGGAEAVNVCAPEGIAEELFSYQGSGTLFTQDDYCQVRPLGLDDFPQAERLLERGQREGMLKLRTPEEMADVLAAGFGATIAGRHLAGVAGLLTAPYASENAGEIVGLYTITRFKGEGIGERLVMQLLTEARSRGLRYVFAVAYDERAQQFFQRLGFERVTGRNVPGAKWIGYDRKRRARLGVFRQLLPAAVC